MQTTAIPVAIYTRKSTDAHVEQDVHSLSVQRASAESFVASQQHRGWVALEEHFDDNNVSGATLERPALDRLKQKIILGEVKVVVINRLDRISRSLSQFLELTEFFDAHGVSLVSVTQNFNTGDSMGRLMVQIIMSFAEFERSLIKDRVTERMHAARKKGRFIGGRPILGYNIKPQGRELEIDPLEAVRVKEIFELYLELRSIKATVKELKKRGWKNKTWVARNGNVTGGAYFSANGLHALLTNQIYVGNVTLKKEIFKGQHEAILDSEFFEQVQQTLKENSLHDGSRKRNKHAALLKGLLCCKACQAPFIHTYTTRHNRKYRYYTCRNKRDNGAHSCSSPPLPAGEIETLVSEQILSVGHDPGLQNLVYEQLVEVVEQRETARKQQLKAARQQLDRVHHEIKTSRELDAPLSLIRHLESKQKEAQNILEALDTTAYSIPMKVDVVTTLQSLKTLWPSFKAEERCEFARTLLERVDYDADGGKVTLHFNDAGFFPVAGEEVAS
ncbi:MAG: hypothetical protein CML13_06965 [Puniceicoccaceae bacterium]|nr:hypothetical protein [Puniceicoccaceae bacterium]|tara:strand:+ start:24216 stop:25724 length:1509 start_codon:yes stop_codon:yes gene_type:complete